MRILATSDLHYTLRQFDWLGQQAAGFDVVVLAGDLLDLASAVEPEVQTVVVQKFLRRLASGRLLFTTSGNHDILEEGLPGERSAQWMEELAGPGLVPDYGCLERDGVLFSAFPWWDGPQGRARAERRLDEDAAKAFREWIWIHHNPPAGSPTAWTGRADGGDALLLEWIERHQPGMVFSGHIHNAPYYPQGSWCGRVGRTWIFNPGRQPGGEPTRIIVDLATRKAEWHSFEGVSAVDL